MPILTVTAWFFSSNFSLIILLSILPSLGRDFSRTLQYLKSAVESNGRLLEKILEKVEKLEIGATSESAVKTNSAESNIDEMLPCKTYEDALKVEETIIKPTDALNKLVSVAPHF